jgi:hypothetical protein
VKLLYINRIVLALSFHANFRRPAESPQRELGPTVKSPARRPIPEGYLTHSSIRFGKPQVGLCLHISDDFRLHLAISAQCAHSDFVSELLCVPKR